MGFGVHIDDRVGGLRFPTDFISRVSARFEEELVCIVFLCFLSSMHKLLSWGLGCRVCDSHAVRLVKVSWLNTVLGGSST